MEEPFPMKRQIHQNGELESSGGSMLGPGGTGPPNLAQPAPL